MNGDSSMLTVVSAERVDPAFVARYAKDDWLLAQLQASTFPFDLELTTHRWLMQDQVKRAIFATLYGELFQTRGLRVLDVGGGISAIGRELAARHEYHLVELGAHDPARRIQEFVESAGRGLVLHDCDWLDLPDLGAFDVVIANDLFPNVDQRLRAFVQRVAPITRHLALSLTCYDSFRFYRAKRIDGDEILTMLAWDFRQTAQSLSHIIADRAEVLSRAISLDVPSAFANGRQVCILRCHGAAEVAGHPLRKAGDDLEAPL